MKSSLLPKILRLLFTPGPSQPDNDECRQNLHPGKKDIVEIMPLCDEHKPQSYDPGDDVCPSIDAIRQYPSHKKLYFSDSFYSLWYWSGYTPNGVPIIRVEQLIYQTASKNHGNGNLYHNSSDQHHLLSQFNTIDGARHDFLQRTKSEEIMDVPNHDIK